MLRDSLFPIEWSWPDLFTYSIYISPVRPRDSKPPNAMYLFIDSIIVYIFFIYSPPPPASLLLVPTTLQALTTLFLCPLVLEIIVPFNWPIILNLLVPSYPFITFVVMEASCYTKLRACLLLFCWHSVVSGEIWIFFAKWAAEVNIYFKNIRIMLRNQKQSRKHPPTTPIQRPSLLSQNVNQEKKHTVFSQE